LGKGQSGKIEKGKPKKGGTKRRGEGPEKNTTPSGCEGDAIGKNLERGSNKSRNQVPTSVMAVVSLKDVNRQGRDTVELMLTGCLEAIDSEIRTELE